MKKILLPLLLVLGLGGLVFWLVTRDKGATISAELRDFAVADTAAVTKVFFATKQPKTLTLTKESNGLWMVNGKYPVRRDAIKILMNTIHGLSVREPVSRMAKESIIKNLATGGIKVEIYQGEKLAKVFFVGNETPDMLGTYMLLRDAETGANSSEPFIMELKGFNGYLTPRFSVNADDWRERSVFKYFAPNIRSIKVEHRSTPTESFEVRQTGPSSGFGLFTTNGNPIPFDTVAVKQYISYYNFIGHEGQAVNLKPAQQDSILRTTPEHIITITDAQGKVNRVALYLKKNDGIAPEDSTAAMPPAFDPDRMYAYSSVDKEMVQVQYFVFGKLLPPTTYFRRAGK
ncbi:MAG: DUF4340 domain-containing protein [Bacteroidia bacterium]|jgi:hypothetical protein|nr:DUF4340 domain-containing protein [Bacteroidia bacterium]